MITEEDLIPFNPTETRLPSISPAREKTDYKQNESDIIQNQIAAFAS
jgi:hypothetical protein